MTIPPPPPPPPGEPVDPTADPVPWQPPAAPAVPPVPPASPAAPPVQAMPVPPPPPAMAPPADVPPAQPSWGDNPYAAPPMPPAPSAPPMGFPTLPPAVGVGPLAPWSQRVVGYLVDALIAAPGTILTNLYGPSATRGIGILYLIGFVYVVAVAVWNRWMKGGQGQTIGRKVAGVTVLKESTGQPLGTGGAFLRDVAHLADTFLCLVGWFFPLWDAKRQTIADKIVGSVAVSVQK